MAPRTKEVFKAALELPLKARTELVAKLLQSLDEAEKEDPAAVERAWADEIKRRLEDIDSGRVKLIPGEQVRRELERDIRRLRRRVSSRRTR